MKKLIAFVLLCFTLCATLMLGAGAISKNDHGYYDYDSNGTVDFTDAIKVLHDILNNPESDASMLRALGVIQGSVAATKVAATVTSIDIESGIATVSTEFCENVTLPLSMLGIPADAKEADYNGIPAVLSVHGSASKFFKNYDGSGKGIYLVSANERFSGTPTNNISKLYAIDELNKNAANGSHKDDNYKSAMLEGNYRENVVLNSTVNSYSRYDNGWYPRVKKVNDDLYLLVYMYGQFGVHLYYVTSTDGLNWNAPQVLWNQAHYPAFTYEDGPLVGTEDKYASVNPDFCVLEDGTILCVYAVRPAKGYKYYPDLSGLFMKRGTPDADGSIIWSDETKIYTGQVWEPSVILRSDGQVQVYFTQVAPDIVEFGYDEAHRSTETGLIVSNDQGNTWIPNIQAGDQNFYRATTVFREYVGDLINQNTGEMRPHYSGQMPVATELYNGKLLVATEIRNIPENGKSQGFRISYGISQSGGSWKELAVGEESDYINLTTGTATSSPYVDRFPSGEIYLTYNYWHNGQDYLVGRLGKPDGSEFGDYFYNAGDSDGIWGSCDVMDSHKVATAMQDVVSEKQVTNDDGTTETEYTYGINIYYHYLNHRINAKETSVILDGYINEWERNSDALFVGSETQAQATVQVAHDKDNVYFLITRHDKCLTSKDTFKMHIAADDSSYYTVTFKIDGKYLVTLTKNGTTTDVASGSTSFVKRFGTVDINTNTDQGALIEIAVPKSEIGLLGKTSFKTTIALENKDNSTVITEDTLDGTDMTSTANWIEVVLD
ncbi:MAG: hypothetical protein IJC81_03275 [Clostridia bacterium]|nr:hypothetical protein [Clostridia bacterium]